jgi:hypothetical protein
MFSLLKAFQNIGCYFSSVGCQKFDVFTEIGLSADQCSTVIAELTGMKCFDSQCGNRFVQSPANLVKSSSMTVDKCLKMCSTNGYKYAGLRR